MSLKSVLADIKKHFAFILIGIIAVLVMAYAGFFLGMSNYGYDLFFRLRGSLLPEKNIVLIVVDESTLDKLGQWPLRRDYYARLLEQLAPARVVGLDILMVEPSAADTALAHAIERHGRVVFPVYITKRTRVARTSARFSPLGSGHIHLEQDIDGVVRDVYHTLYIDGQQLPSFTSSIHEKLSGKSFPRERVVIRKDTRQAPPQIIQMDLRKINYYGPQGTFPSFSLADVIEGRYGSDFFKDKIVLVGVTAAGLEAGVITPFSQQRNHMSGVETHANILGNLIETRRVVSLPMPMVWLISVGLSFLCFLLMLRFRGWRAIVLWLGAIMTVFVAAFVLFAFLDFWLDPFPFAVLLLFMFFVAYVFRMEEARKKLAEAEELWEDSFNTIDDAIIVMDGNGASLQMNGAAKKMQEQDPRLVAKISRHRPDNVDHPVDEAKQNNPEIIRDEPVKDEIVDAATDRYFAVRTLPRFNEERKLIGFVQVIQDITGQKKAAREKQRLEFELMQAQKMEAIGTLAGGVAHDFNNILMGIQGYVSLLLFGLHENNPHFAKLKKIEAQVQSAANLTRQLLGFARGGKYEVKLTNLNELLEKSSDVFGRTKKEVAISTRFEENLWLVLVDRGQVEQVLLNMYINSWQAMPQGGDLYLETKNVILNDDAVALYGVKAGPYVKISITDTGSGMDEATRNRIFEPFFTTKEQGKGTGLGLASAYGIIKNHGGFIDVQSDMGKGSTFCIYLPATEEIEAADEVVSEKSIYRGRETILVVDDEPVNVIVMKELLESLGYHVLCAGSGQEAMSIYMVKKGLIDLVILDMVMPGMGGGATFDALRAINSDVKIILSSGYSVDGVARTILDRGCNGFIQKPFLLAELSRKIREIL